MPSRNYAAYAATPSGIAARARAHARYVARRREQNARAPKPETDLLMQAIRNWNHHARTL
jgi:hypothetical protein